MIVPAASFPSCCQYCLLAFQHTVLLAYEFMARVIRLVGRQNCRFVRAAKGAPYEAPLGIMMYWSLISHATEVRGK